MAECDLGRDYEHCLELQKKLNDTEEVSDDGVWYIVSVVNVYFALLPLYYDGRLWCN